jgi:hypothetical protein
MGLSGCCREAGKMGGVQAFCHCPRCLAHTLHRAAKLSLGTVATFPVLYTPPMSRLDCTPYSTVREVAALERRSQCYFVHARKGEGSENCANVNNYNVTFVSVAICYLRKLVHTT